MGSCSVFIITSDIMVEGAAAPVSNQTVQADRSLDRAD